MAPVLTDDQRWAAWVATGVASDRLTRRRLARVASVVAAGLLGGMLLALTLS